MGKERVYHGRIPVGYQVWRVPYGLAIDPKEEYEVRIGQRVLAPVPTIYDAIDLCEADIQEQGSRFTKVLQEATNPPSDGCSQCLVKMEADGEKVRWTCVVCNRLVCRACTLCDPVTPKYFDMTLCSRECWIKAGEPDPDD